MNGASVEADWTSGTAVLLNGPPPLPVCQRQYPRKRYPVVEQQQVLRSQKYRYQPHDPVLRAHYEHHGPQGKGEGQGHKK